MICPFCRTRLTVFEYPSHTVQLCENHGCMNDDMTRYSVSYNNYPTFLQSRIFMMDKFYIQIDYRNNKTIISKLEACFLFDSIQLPKAIVVDLKNPFKILPKIKILMMFS